MIAFTDCNTKLAISLMGFSGEKQKDYINNILDTWNPFSLFLIFNYFLSLI
jgi:hypothetical protein